eukprot:4740803-Amphidinium_carterae.1
MLFKKWSWPFWVLWREAGWQNCGAMSHGKPRECAGGDWTAMDLLARLASPRGCCQSAEGGSRDCSHSGAAECICPLPQRLPGLIVSSASSSAEGRVGPPV